MKRKVWYLLTIMTFPIYIVVGLYASLKADREEFKIGMMEGFDDL